MIQEGLSVALTSWKTGSGSAIPFKAILPIDSTLAIPLTRLAVCGAIRTVPGSACCSSRAAMWAVMPATS